MYALCVSGAVNTQGFAWIYIYIYIYALHIHFHSFRSSRIIGLILFNYANLSTLRLLLFF